MRTKIAFLILTNLIFITITHSQWRIDTMYARLGVQSVTIVSNEGKDQEFYDESGRLVKIIDNKTYTTEYIYGPNNKIKLATYTYVPTKKYRSIATEEYFYNSNDSLEKMVYKDTQIENGVTTLESHIETYAYDANGFRIQFDYTSNTEDRRTFYINGDDGKVDSLITYNDRNYAYSGSPVYDDTLRLSEFILFTYDSSGQLTSRVPQLAESVYGFMEYYYEYDSKGNVIKINYDYKNYIALYGGDFALSNEAFTYENNKLIKKIDTNPSNQETSAYTYDENGFLTLISITGFNITEPDKPYKKTVKYSYKYFRK